MAEKEEGVPKRVKTIAAVIGAIAAAVGIITGVWAMVLETRSSREERHQREVQIEGERAKQKDAEARIEEARARQLEAQVQSQKDLSERAVSLEAQRTQQKQAEVEKAKKEYEREQEKHARDDLLEAKEDVYGAISDVLKGGSSTLSGLVRLSAHTQDRKYRDPILKTLAARAGSVVDEAETDLMFDILNSFESLDEDYLRGLVSQAEHRYRDALRRKFWSEFEKRRDPGVPASVLQAIVSDLTQGQSPHVQSFTIGFIARELVYAFMGKGAGADYIRQYSAERRLSSPAQRGSSFQQEYGDLRTLATKSEGLAGVASFSGDPFLVFAYSCVTSTAPGWILDSVSGYEQRDMNASLHLIGRASESAKRLYFDSPEMASAMDYKDVFDVLVESWSRFTEAIGRDLGSLERGTRDLEFAAVSGEFEFEYLLAFFVSRLEYGVLKSLSDLLGRPETLNVRLSTVERRMQGFQKKFSDEIAKACTGDPLLECDWMEFAA